MTLTRKFRQKRSIEHRPLHRLRPCFEPEILRQSLLGASPALGLSGGLADSDGQDALLDVASCDCRWVLLSPAGVIRPFGPAPPGHKCEFGRSRWLATAPGPGQGGQRTKNVRHMEFSADAAAFSESVVAGDSRSLRLYLSES